MNYEYTTRNFKKKKTQTIMSANTSTTPSAFAAAIHNHSKFDTGDNGAVVMKTSGNVFVDYFTNISFNSSRETVAEAVRQMVDYARHIYKETAM